MTDDQRDPAAGPQAQAEALAEGFRPLSEFANAVTESFSRAARAWLEQNRPLLSALAEAAQDPRVRAYIEARERGEIPAPEPPRPCHCFCGRTHPGEYVCDGEAVTSRHYETESAGPVDVSLCAPCAAAQFLAEVT